MIDIAIIALFFIANLYLGHIAAKKTRSLDHFSVGHRGFSTFAIFATLTASFIGGGYTIGNAAKVYDMGMVYAFALLGFSLKEILVALFIAPRMDQHRDCLSIGDIIAKSYGKNAKIITGIFSIIICAGILGAQVGGMGAIFEHFLGVSPLLGIAIGFGIIIFYSTIGGMRAVVYTDILQFLILIIGVPLIFVMGLHYVGGWNTVVQHVPENHIHFLQSPADYVFFITLFITFIFGETLVPPYVQRLFMAKSSDHTRRATMASGLVSIPFFIIVGGIGLIALTINPNLEGNDAIPYVVNIALPVGIKGFVIAGILSVIMSSAAGFLNAGAVAFVNDIVKPLRKTDISEKSLLLMARSSTIFIGLIAVGFALAITNVLDILLYAYNFWAPVIIVPFVATIFNLAVRPSYFMIGSSAGIITTIIWTHVLNQPGDISGVVVGVLGNLIAFSGAMLFTRAVGTTLDSQQVSVEND